MPRPDGRAVDELRPITFERDYTEMASGSALVSFGRTRVLCTASVDEDTPRWMRGSGKGWVTAEYSMLPGSSPERIEREAAKGRVSGRTQEIQRLIGRSLRAVTDMRALGERQVIVDCDVLQADGGTRTASICGGYLALHDAVSRLVQTGAIKQHPIAERCAAISVGIVNGEPALDLPYVEDSTAEVDMNVVMISSGRFVEVQGTAEGMAFSRSELDVLLGLAEKGIREIFALQDELLSDPPARAVRVVLASANPDKAKEILEIVGPLGIEVLPRPSSVPDVDETADTFEGNARLKATAIAAAAGLPALADDTGLEVDFLGRAPGVHTARYAGVDATYADNVALLLESLKAVPLEQRTARFITVAMVCWPDGREVVAEGFVRGHIALESRGEQGFGYDPVFIPDEGDGRTFAEMALDGEARAVASRARVARARR